MAPPTDPLDLGGRRLGDRLSAWLASARADVAAAGRARERWLARAAAESATFAGVLLDLAERGEEVVVSGRTGRRLRGRVEAVGADFAALALTEGGAALVLFSAVAAVRGEPGAPPAPGDRPLQVEVGVAEALSVLAEDRPRVLVVCAGGEGLAGELVAVGQDVLHLRLDDAGRSTAYVPLASIAEVRW